MLLAGRKEIDQPAAHRELAGIAHRLGAAVAVRLEQSGQPLEIDPLAGRQPRHELADAEGGQRPLGRRVDGGDQQLRLARLALKRVQGRQPFRGGAKRR